MMRVVDGPAAGPAMASQVPPDAAPPGADAELVRQARAGDERAFARLHRRFAPMVHAVLVAHAAPREADDLMQEVFLAAWRALPQAREEEHFGAWLAAIARRVAARSRRGSRPAPASLDSLRQDGRTGSNGRTRGTDAFEPADPRAGRDRSGELLAVLRTLPVAYRETLAMRLVEGLTGPEIAAATGLTHGSVRVNLVRGMTLYKEALRRAGWP